MSRTFGPVLVFVALIAACAPGGESGVGASPGADAQTSADSHTTPFGQACDDHGDCGPGFCHRPSATCRECRMTADCAAGEVCEEGRCAPGAGCRSDLDCIDAGRLCDERTHVCVACESAADCGPGAACIGHSCQTVNACSSSLDCAATRQLCADVYGELYPPEVDSVCVDCTSNLECGPGERCVEHDCLPVCRDAGKVCGWLDDGWGVSCGECPADSECVGDGQGCVATTPLPAGVASFVRAALFDSDSVWIAQVRHVDDWSGSSEQPVHLAIVDKASGYNDLITTPNEYYQPAIQSLAVTDAAVFAVIGYGSEIHRFDRATGAVTLFWDGEDHTDWDPGCKILGADAASAVVACHYAFWDEGSDDHSFVVELATGRTQEIDAAIVGPSAIAGDDLYWTADGELRVTHVPSGERLVLAPAATSGGVRIHAGYTYFVQGDYPSLSLVRRALGVGDVETIAGFETTFDGLGSSGVVVARAGGSGDSYDEFFIAYGDHHETRLPPVYDVVGVYRRGTGIGVVTSEEIYLVE